MQVAGSKCIGRRENLQSDHRVPWIAFEQPRILPCRERTGVHSRRTEWNAWSPASGQRHSRMAALYMDLCQLEASSLNSTPGKDESGWILMPTAWSSAADHGLNHSAWTSPLGGPGSWILWAI